MRLGPALMAEQNFTDALALAEEELRVRKREVATGRVRIRTVVDQTEEMVREHLQSEHLDISRVAVGRELQASPEVRMEGEVLIIPVVEEVLVVEKRLVLKEELHVRRVVSQEQVEVPVTLRKQRAEVERVPPPETDHNQNQEEQ